MTLDLPDGLFQVVDFQHVKPGKGGAFVRTTLRNMRNGGRSTRPSVPTRRWSRPVIDKRDMQFLYRDGSDFVFMDNESYDQLHVPPVSLGRAANYIVDGSTVTLQMYGAEIVGSDLPAAVELTVSETEPGVQGDRVSGARKPATLETGLVLQVPLFVNPGDRIKVDTRSASTSPGRDRSPQERRSAGARPRPALRGRDEGPAPAESCWPTCPSRPTSSPRSRAGGRRAPERIDGLLSEHAKGWTLARMPALDRSRLRMGTAELYPRRRPDRGRAERDGGAGLAVLHRRQRALRQRAPRQDRHRGPRRVIARAGPAAAVGGLVLRPWRSRTRRRSSRPGPTEESSGGPASRSVRDLGAERWITGDEERRRRGLSLDLVIERDGEWSARWARPFDRDEGPPRSAGGRLPGHRRQGRRIRRRGSSSSGPSPTLGSWRRRSMRRGQRGSVAVAERAGAMVLL